MTGSFDYEAVKQAAIRGLCEGSPLTGENGLPPCSGIFSGRTGNAVEGYHRQLRKVTRMKGAFSSDVALQKLVYLTIRNLESTWETTTHNWRCSTN